MSQLAESKELLAEVTRRADHRLLVYGEISVERRRQDAKWGHQHWPHTRPEIAVIFRSTMDLVKELTDEAMKNKLLTWTHILLEEMTESFAEEDWPARRAELIQAAAVIVAEIEDGDLFAEPAAE